MKTGILLVNLGTPDAPTTPALKRYLAQFLSDPRVIDLSRWKWLPILHTMILPKRAPRVAKLYQSIWTEQGSPLLAISRQQQQALQAKCDEAQLNVIVELAMTYDNPSMQQGLNKLLQANVDKLIILPLYPQYSSTTSASVFDAFARASTAYKKMLPFDFILSYHDNEYYISALAESIKARLKPDELLLFSFHGIPARYAQEGDYYPQHCEQTAQLVAEKLGLTPTQWMMSYQSRFGKEVWLQPYTDETLQQLPHQGIKKVAVVCPGFAVDCLETLEEIAVENRNEFLQAGGESYHYIPALNAEASHIELLFNLIKNKLS